jgi:hypothetical protein
MKKFIPFLLLAVAAIFLGTSQGSGGRLLNINGYIGSESGATAGTNGSFWEQNESLSGNDGVTWYMSWDDSKLFVGREGGNNSEPDLIYVQSEYSGSVYSTSATNYDNFTPDFTAIPINFAAYIKSGYDEYRTYNGSWGSATTFLNPVFQTNVGVANMEVVLFWDYVTNTHGKPSNFRTVFYKTNGNSGSLYAWGNSPTGNATGFVNSPTISSWWGGYNVTSGISPNTGSNNPLPVELISFGAVSNRNGVELRWSTASEKNNFGFEVERRSISDPSGEFKHAAFVNGAGTSNDTRQYMLVDQDIPAGKYLYRLKQIDRDGKSVYSHNVEVEVGIVANQFLLESNYPNPFNPSTMIHFSVPTEGKATLKVYNAAGIEVATLYTGIAETGKSYQIRFDASSLSAGTYFSRLEFGGKTLVQKMAYVK